jgi:uncharacterized protein
VQLVHCQYVLHVTDPKPVASVFRLTVSADQLLASLEVAPTRGDDMPVGLDEVLAYLTSAGITYGVDAADVAKAVEVRGKNVVVARGLPPRDGEDGRLEIEPSLLEIGGRPRVNDNGEVDLFELNLIHTVREDQVLARRVSPTPKQDGRGVRGQVLLSRSVWAAPARAGPGSRLKEGGLEIIATLSGHAVVIGEQLGVSSIYQVRGDVGVATGNIEFVGSVVVQGDVCPGYRVRADGDVEIHGNVNGGIVEAGGNVSVRYGVLGQGRVVAAGTAKAKFVEYAEVRAGAEVWVSDGIMQSKVTAGTRIEVLGRYGSIVGGNIFARLSLSARELGSSAGVRTSIAVGVAPELVPESERLDVRANELARQIPVVQVRRTYLANQAALGRLNRRGAQEMDAVTAQLRALLEAANVVETRQIEIAAELADLGVAFVDARDVCRPGVYVMIGSNTMLVRESLRNVRFRYSAKVSKIEMTSL